MTLNTELQTDFINHVTQYGNLIRLKVYIPTYSGTNYDDQTYLAASGASLWTHGVLEPVVSDDIKLTEAGRITLNDSKLFLPGSYHNSCTIFTKFGVGSPTPVEYTMIEDGRFPRSIGSTVIFDKCFVRVLNNGSFAYEI